MHAYIPLCMYMYVHPYVFISSWLLITWDQVAGSLAFYRLEKKSNFYAILHGINSFDVEETEGS